MFFKSLLTLKTEYIHKYILYMKMHAFFFQSEFLYNSMTVYIVSE